MQTNRLTGHIDLSRPNGQCRINFYNDPARLDQLDWDVIKSNSWHNKSSQKQAEFLVADQFKWDSIIGIGCMTADIESQVRGVLSSAAHLPKVLTKPGWYF